MKTYEFAEPAEGQTVRCSLCGVPYAECPHAPCQSCGRATDDATDLCDECQTADLPPDSVQYAPVSSYYIVVTGNGDLLCDGVSEHEIARVAQEWADRLAETVYYSENGNTDDSDDEDSVTAVEPRTVRCECGQYTGERCVWIGSPDDTVVVEFMPSHLRASHKAAGNVGRYPHNGAIRMRCERSCAESIVEHDPEWAWIVE